MVNVFVLALLTRGDEVLLSHRIGDSFGSGLYGLIGGKVEQGETALQAVQREVHEETLLDISADAFQLVHTLHRKGTETEFVALCFRVDVSNYGAPVNNEPHKHDELRFFPVNNLPDSLLPAHRQVIACIERGMLYSEHGW